MNGAQLCAAGDCIHLCLFGFSLCYHRNVEKKKAFIGSYVSPCSLCCGYSEAFNFASFFIKTSRSADWIHRHSTHHNLYAPPPFTWPWLVAAFSRRSWNPGWFHSFRTVLTLSDFVALQLCMCSPPQQFSNSCPLVFLFSSQQPHAPPTTSPSSVRRASTSPPLRAQLLFGQVLFLSFLLVTAALADAPSVDAPSLTLIRTPKCC